MIQLEKKLKEFGSVPVGHGTLLSILGEYRSPNDKIARIRGVSIWDDKSLGRRSSYRFCMIATPKYFKKDEKGYLILAGVDNCIIFFEIN